MVTKQDVWTLQQQCSALAEQCQKAEARAKEAESRAGKVKAEANKATAEADALRRKNAALAKEAETLRNAARERPQKPAPVQKPQGPTRDEAAATKALRAALDASEAECRRLEAAAANAMRHATKTEDMARQIDAAAELAVAKLTRDHAAKLQAVEAKAAAQVERAKAAEKAAKAAAKAAKADAAAAIKEARADRQAAQAEVRKAQALATAERRAQPVHVDLGPKVADLSAALDAAQSQADRANAARVKAEKALAAEKARPAPKAPAAKPAPKPETPDVRHFRKEIAQLQADLSAAQRDVADWKAKALSIPPAPPAKIVTVCEREPADIARIEDLEREVAACRSAQAPE